MGSYSQLIMVQNSASAGQVPQANGNGGYTWVTPAAGVNASNASPAMDGTADAGSSADYARADHVHPTDTNRAAKSHAHGSITNAGAITASAVALANGDSLAFIDSSDSSKIKKTTITFDGSNAGLALTQKGTFESFLPTDNAAMTGTPTAPTASAGTNSTQVATTAFVAAAVKTQTDKMGAANGYATLDADAKIYPYQIDKAMVEVTTSRTLAVTDDNRWLNVTASSNITLTVPAHSSVELPVGAEIIVCQWGTGSVTFSAASGVTIQNADGLSIPARNTIARMKQISTDYWILTMDHQDSNYQPTSGSVTIATSDWSSNSATKNATGVTTNNNVIVTPSPSSFANAAMFGVYCSAQGSGTLTFSVLNATPTSDITMNYLIV